MFRLFNVFSNTSDDESSQTPPSSSEPPKQPFTTQTDMLLKKKVPVAGVCAQLTNAWLRDRIKGREADFLKDEDECMNEVYREARQQKEIIDKGDIKEAPHSAFVDTRTPHRDIEVPRQEVTNAEGLEHVVGPSRFALFSYPTGNGSRHLVGFENDPQGKECRYFDADFPGGETVSSCQELREQMAQVINSSYPPNAGATRVGLSQ